MSRDRAMLQAIDSLAVSGLTVVDGGHFTLRRSSAGSAAALGGGLFYTKAARDAPPCDFEIAAAPVTNDPASRWAVYRVSEADVASFRRRHTTELMFVRGPSETETETLRMALRVYAEVRAAGGNVLLRIMVGDLGIPVELREPLDWALPQTYRVLLAEAGVDSVGVLRESRCRNAGGRQARERFKRLLDAQGRFDADYARFGYGVVKVGAGALYLIADALLDASGVSEPALPLSKHGTRPTCAVTLAGCMLDLLERGADRYIAFHDEMDDRHIRAKIVEGVIIAAFLEPERAPGMVCEINTLSEGRPNHVDWVCFSRIRRPGAFEDLDALISETRSIIGMTNLDWMQDVEPAER